MNNKITQAFGTVGFPTGMAAGLETSSEVSGFSRLPGREVFLFSLKQPCSPSSETVGLLGALMGLVSALERSGREYAPVLPTSIPIHPGVGTHRRGYHRNLRSRGKPSTVGKPPQHLRSPGHLLFLLTSRRCSQRGWSMLQERVCHI